MAENQWQTDQERKEKQVVGSTKKLSCWKKLVLGVLVVCGIVYGLRFIPGYRSSDQLYLEDVVFQPLFDFLSTEEKDFSGVDYYAVLYIYFDSRMQEQEKIDWTLRRETDQFNSQLYMMDSSGEQIISSKINGVNGEISPAETGNSLYKTKFKPILDKKFFKTFLIEDYEIAHPMTGQRWISYYGIGDAFREQIGRFLPIKDDDMVYIKILASSDREQSFDIIIELKGRDRIVYYLCQFVEKE